MPIDRDEMNRRLVEEFRIEAEERLATLQEALLAIEQGGETVPDMEAAKRQAHTLKGAAQSIGLENLGLAVHAFETGLARAGERSAPELVDLLLWTVDQFRTAVANPDLEALTWHHVHGALESGRRPADTTPQAPPPRAEADTHDEPPELPHAAADTTLPLQKRATDNQKTIRVATPVVDRLINEVGELLVTGGVYSLTADELLQLGGELRSCRTQIRHALSAPDAPDSVAWLREELDTVANQLERWTESVGNLSMAVRNRGMRVAASTSALHESVMETRMLPASALFRRYPRLVRDLSRELDRPTELVTEGDDCTIDWVIIERIEEPVLHLIRNALAHGLEPEDDRVAAGKRSSGRVTLRAQLRGHMVVVEVEDDGAGLDLGAIHQQAVRRGLLSGDNRRDLGMAEAVDLLFTRRGAGCGQAHSRATRRCDRRSF